MRSRVIIAGCLIAGFVGAAAAQSSNNRIDLGAIAQPTPAAFTIAFVDSPPICPERHGALQISGDAIWLLRSPRADTGGGGVTKPVDDETYRHGMTAAYDCVTDMTFRAQAYRDGLWIPLLVPQSMRPSLRQSTSPEELRKKMDAIAAAVRQREGMTPQARAEARQAWLQGPGHLPRSIRIQQQTGGFATYVQFEEAPENCINAVGEYRLDQKGITFRFPTDFSDDYNRFAAELTRVDDFRGQLTLVRGDCRVEITIGKAIRSHGRWLPIPIASVTRSR